MKHNIIKYIPFMKDKRRNEAGKGEEGKCTSEAI